MNDYYLNNLITQSDSAYDLVMKLKKLKETGCNYVKANNDKHKMGSLMYDIVSMSKHGYKYPEIVAELMRY